MMDENNSGSGQRLRPPPLCVFLGGGGRFRPLTPDDFICNVFTKNKKCGFKIYYRLETIVHWQREKRKRRKELTVSHKCWEGDRHGLWMHTAHFSRMRCFFFLQDPWKVQFNSFMKSTQRTEASSKQERAVSLKSRWWTRRTKCGEGYTLKIENKKGWKSLGTTLQ